MKISEFEKMILEILPRAQFGDDNEGQILIYTGLYEKSVIMHEGLGNEEEELIEIIDENI